MEVRRCRFGTGTWCRLAPWVASHTSDGSSTPSRWARRWTG